MSTSIPETGSADNPLITIAIPTFNRASWLIGCIESALSQTYPNFEVVISDNASTDGTDETLNRFRDRRLRVVRQKNNIGLLPNWNACLAEARGDYIVFVSDDDRISPWMLERCATLVKAQPQIPVVIALSDMQSVEEGHTLVAIPSRKLGTGIWDGADILLEVLDGRLIAPMCTVMIQTAALRARGGFPIDWPHLADKASWVPMLLAGKAGLVNESCGTCCVHDATESSQFSINVLLNDVRRFVDLISSMVDHSIDDPGKRREVKSQAEIHLARCVIYLIASRRKGGAKLAQTLPTLCQYRRNLGRIGIGNAFKLARPIAIIVLPGAITDWLRRLSRMVK